MDKSTVLAVIGVVATVIFGGWSIYLVIKRRYLGRITFLKESSIGLFDSIVRNLSELSVLYLNQPVSPNLVLLKGVLHNTGSIDITEAMTEEKMCFNLPEGYKWITAKVVSSSPNVRAVISMPDPNRLMFDMGLFRCDEHITFEALAEVPMQEETPRNEKKDAGKELNKVINITHRIANTQKVNIEDLYPNPEKVSIEFWAPAAIVMIVLVVFIVLKPRPSEPMDRYSHTRLNFLMEKDEGIKREVVLLPRSDGLLDVKGIQDDSLETIETSDFSKYRWEPKPVSTPKIDWFIILGTLWPLLLIMLAFIILPFLLSIYLGRRRKRRIDRLLAS